jgi:hypothetical protein
LNGVAANSFTVAGATTSNPANSGVVTAVFPTTNNVINLAAIPGVTAPAAGATPVTTITENEQYTGTVTWSPAVSGTFAASTVYTASITLTVKTGYTLNGVAANSFTVAGATTSNPANSGVVTAVFPTTAIGITFTGDNNYLALGKDMVITATPSITPESWQWYLDGVAIAGANSDNLTIGSALAKGTYKLNVIAQKGNMQGANSFTFKIVNAIDNTCLADTYVSSDTNNLVANYGQSSYLLIGDTQMSASYGTNPNTYRAYLKFDLNNSNLNIKKAYIYVYMYSQNGYLLYDNFYIHNVLQDWDESLISWNSQPNYEITGYIISTKPFQGSINQWHKMDITDLVCRWKDGLSNYGILLESDNNYGYPCFDSKEGSNKPYIEILYE